MHEFAAETSAKEPQSNFIVSTSSTLNMKNSHLQKRNSKTQNLWKENQSNPETNTKKNRNLIGFSKSYQGMEQDQYDNSNEGIKPTSIQSRAIISQNDSVIGDAHNPKNQEDHNRAQTPQSCAELEHIPSHGSSRSMHNITQKTQNSWRKILTF